MLAKEYRLTKKRDFSNIYERGTRYSGRYFLIRSLPNKDGNQRFGVVISTKTAKLAVDRNRHKRQVRAELEKDLSTLPKGLDVVITVKNTVADRKQWPEFREELRSLLAKLS